MNNKGECRSAEKGGDEMLQSGDHGCVRMW